MFFYTVAFLFKMGQRLSMPVSAALVRLHRAFCMAPSGPGALSVLS